MRDRVCERESEGERDGERGGDIVIIDQFS